MTGWADSLRIEKDASDDLGLVHAAFWAGALSAEEVSLWLIDLVAARSPATTPAWLLRAPDTVSHPMELHKALGIVPGTDTADRPEYRAALDGIAWLRDTGRGDPTLGECTPRAEALTRLAEQPDLLDRLSRIVPQADLPSLQTIG